MEGGPAVFDRLLSKTRKESDDDAGLVSMAAGVVHRQRLLIEADASNDIRFSSTYLMTKRVFDVCGAILCAIVFSPILIGVALSLGRSGQIFFAHTRIGHAGKPFKVYKFRSMVQDADRVLAELLANDENARREWEADHKLRNDPRITRTGAFLRKTSLDELPQLWNVLKGDMSLVGPRPIVTDELKKYGRASRYYLAVKPGITGLWQVTGRNDVDYKRRVALDRRYARTASLRLDFMVLLKTVKIVLAKNGAY